MLGYIAATISFALAGVLVYIYYLKKGQFDDSEEVKYQVFREDD